MSGPITQGIVNQASGIVVRAITLVPLLVILLGIAPGCVLPGTAANATEQLAQNAHSGDEADLNQDGILDALDLEAIHQHRRDGETSPPAWRLLFQMSRNWHEQLGPNPLEVELVWSPTDTTSAWIGPDGGTLDLPSPDDLDCRLIIPASALMNLTQVSATRLDSASGVPFESGIDIAWRLQPEGIYLLESASIEINDASLALPQLGTTAFRSGQTGDPFHLQPLTCGSSGRSIQVLSLSSYGLINAASLERMEFHEDYPPAEPREKALQILGNIAAGSCDRPLNESDFATLDDTLQEWWTQDVGPSLAAAVTDAVMLPGSAGNYLTWKSLVQEWGDTDTLAPAMNEGRDSFARATWNALHQARVAANGVPTPANLSDMLRWHVLAVLQDVASINPQLDFATEIAAVTRIARFEFRGQMTLEYEQNELAVRDVGTLTIPMNLDSSPIKLTGRGSGTQNGLTQGNGCIGSGGGSFNTPRVHQAMFDINLSENPPDTDLRVHFTHGNPAASIYQISCGVGAPIGTAVGIKYMFEFHDEEALTNGFLFENWGQGCAQGILCKDYQTIENGTSEDSTFRVTHMPE